MTSTNHMPREQLLEAILARAAYDRAFRVGLLASPKQAITAAFGVTIPEQFRIRFIEKDTDLDALVVLPEPGLPGGELTDSDLDTVHGGASGGFGPMNAKKAPW
jgi:hypothetical protein